MRPCSFSSVAGTRRAPSERTRAAACRTGGQLTARGARLLQGFTLVELLVVIAIIGVLVALLLPAVQAAREAARRAQCQNHVKQIVLAIQEYHGAHGRIPDNYAANVPDSPGHSWMTRILPQIEQAPLFALLEFDEPRQHPNNLRVAQTPIPLFQCPSDTHDGMMSPRANTSATVKGGTDGAPRAVNNYKSCWGRSWILPFGRWQCGAAEDVDRMKGLMNGIESGEAVIRLRDVTDGTSLTFALGEAVPAFCDFTWWYIFNGTVATTCTPLNAPPPAPAPSWDDPAALSPLGVPAAAFWWENASFMSRHPGGAYFGLVDGSCRFVNDDIDQETYRALGSIGGGEVIGDF